jgi:septal ring-binding cell division protein DamX
MPPPPLENQDDCGLLGGLDKIFGSNGSNGALQYLLGELKEVGLEPNLKKFQAYATPPAAAAVPPLLKRPFFITCPVLRAEVEDATAKEAAKEAAAAVKKTRDDEKEAATAAAKAAAKAADDAMKSAPSSTY